MKFNMRGGNRVLTVQKDDILKCCRCKKETPDDIYYYCGANGDITCRDCVLDPKIKGCGNTRTNHSDYLITEIEFDKNDEKM